MPAQAGIHATVEREDAALAQPMADDNSSSGSVLSMPPPSPT